MGLAWVCLGGVVCADSRRNGLMMLFDRSTMLFLIRVILHTHLSSSLFSGKGDLGCGGRQAGAGETFSNWSC